MPDALLGPLWPQIAPYLQSACDRSSGRYTVEWLAENIADRTMYLWAAISPDQQKVVGAAVTHMNRYPTGLQVLQVIAAGGHGVTGVWQVAEVMERLKAYAHAYGCHEIEWFGRDGFGRLAKAYGASRMASVYRVEV